MSTDTTTPCTLSSTIVHRSPIARHLNMEAFFDCGWSRKKRIYDVNCRSCRTGRLEEEGYPDYELALKQIIELHVLLCQQVVDRSPD